MHTFSLLVRETSWLSFFVVIRSILSRIRCRNPLASVKTSTKNHQRLHMPRYPDRRRIDPLRITRLCRPNPSYCALIHLMLHWPEPTNKSHCCGGARVYGAQKGWRVNTEVSNMITFCNLCLARSHEVSTRRLYIFTVTNSSINRQKCYHYSFVDSIGRLLWHHKTFSFVKLT